MTAHPPRARSEGISVSKVAELLLEARVLLLERSDLLRELLLRGALDAELALARAQLARRAAARAPARIRGVDFAQTLRARVWPRSGRSRRSVLPKS